MRKHSFRFSIVLALILIATVRAQTKRPEGLAEAIKLDISAQKLTWDAQHSRLLAIVPVPAPPGPAGFSASRESEIATIDPVRGVVESVFRTGGEASDLAVSPDGNYLFVVFGKNATVRRFRMPAHTIDLDIDLEFVSRPAGAGRGAPEIQAIAPLPGNPPALAIATEDSVMVYDNATRRPGFVRGQKVRGFEVRPDGQLIGTGPETVSFVVDAAGIRVTDISPRWPGGNAARLSGGSLQERIAYGASIVGGLQIPDITQKDLLVVARPEIDQANPPAFNIVTVSRYDTSQFAVTATLKFEATGIPPNSTAPATAALAWDQGFALAYSKDLFILRRDQIKETPAKV